MTPSLLGCHWIRTHPEGRDFDHVNRMQYRSVKTFEWMHKDRNFCADLLAALPKDAYILTRNHPRSEEKEDVWRDPVGTGTRHANAWAFDIANGECHLPIDRTFFLGANELDATTGDRNAIDLYTTAYLERLAVHGLRGGAFNFSTGHPRTVDGTGGTPADYSVFERSRRAIVNGHHIGVLHIYGTAAVPCTPGHFDRLKACPWQDVEWIVGEMGSDEHVIGGGKHDGFLISMADDPARYCAWLDTLILGIDDPRIHSYQVFSYDFSHPWSSFDTRPIRDALESYDWRHTRQQPTSPTPTTPPTVTTHLPQIGAGKPGALFYVSAEDGLNLRAEPSDKSAILTALPFAEQVRVIGVSSVPGWVYVRAGSQEGFMASSYLTLTPPVPEPAPEPPEKPAPLAAGIIDPLVAQAILRVESGGRALGADGRPIIRFEAHVFEQRAGIDTDFFDYASDAPWMGQDWRPSVHEQWRDIHTGKQADEYAAFEFAKSLNLEAAHQSISVGAAQILGINHARIGYPSAEAMFKAFHDPLLQIVGFLNFCLSDSALMDAMRRKDWRTVALRYNGSGQVDLYAGLMERTYRELGGQ